MLAGSNLLKMANKISSNIKRGILKKLNKHYKSKGTIHLPVILVCLVIILKLKCRNHENTQLKLENEKHTIYINSSVYWCQILAKKSNKMKSYNFSRALCILLILLSNDVQPNPGPSPVPSICELCGYEIEEPENYLQCQECHRKYHFNCTDTTHSINGSFEWICPTQTCTPNHEERYHVSNLNANNSFDALVENQFSYDISQHQPIQIELLETQEEEENYQSLQELPRINHTDYQGKDLCRSCSRHVNMNQQAISCDQCEMWIHRKCSDMGKKTYEKLKAVQHFKWVCNKCRKNETKYHEKMNVHNLLENEKPHTFAEVKGDGKDLLIVNINCRSIINKIEEIHYIFKETDPDIACMCETWFDESVPKQAYIPPGYKVIRHDRTEAYKQRYGKNHGGGVAIYYKENLKVEKKAYLTDEIEEILWVHIKGKNSFLLGTMYRADYTDILNNIDENGESKLEENIRKASELSNSLILTGDYNIDMINVNNRDTIRLQHIYEPYGLNQLINKPTRIDPKSKRSTIIDHIWTNVGNIKSHGTLQGVSDHLGTYVKLNIKKEIPENQIIRYRCFKNYDKNTFNINLSEAIENSNMQHHLTECDVNSATDELLKVIQNTINQIAPIKEMLLKDKRKNIPWFTAELKTLIINKNQYLSDYYSYGIEVFKKRAKEISNQINYLKRKLKKSFFTEKLNNAENNPKKYWQIINEITQRTSEKQITEPDNMSQIKANKFNEYFATVGTKIQHNLKHNCKLMNLKGLEGFSFKHEQQSSIEKLIDGMKTDVAVGNDDISARIIKDAKETIAPVLTKILNLSYDKNIFPTSMKIAKIKAIHKKEDYNDFSNYRPISILPALSKIFERSATNQLIDFLETNNIINSNQHAYRKAHNTATCLFEVTNYLYQILDEKKLAAVISLDLSKAFDSINHNLLLNKLSTMGLSENSILWVKSYLTNRQQFAQFKDFTSTSQEITAGVPQGSIIGPLLFLCFTNDLYTAFDKNHQIYSYADDTQIIVNANDEKQLTKKVEETIKIAQSWYSKNSMKNNTGKTEILYINSRTNNKKIYINIVENGKRKTLHPKPFVKILGVFLDEKLTWDKHIRYVKKNATNSIRNIHRVNHLLPIKTRILLYLTLIMPHFDYADIIYGGCNKYSSKKLQVAQNFAIRSITGTKKSVSPEESFAKLKFLNLEKRRLVHEAVFAQKSVLHKNPQRISLSYMQHYPKTDTRNASKGTLNLPSHKSSKYQNSPLFRTIAAWNSSPKDTPTHNTKVFKSHFQKNLIHETYSKH